MSAQIRRLERELGQVLLDRSGGTVRLTDAGAAVLPYARAALAAVAAVRDTVDALGGLTRGHVTVGMIGSISSPSPALPPELATEVVVDERLVLAVSHSDALARRKTVSLDAIRDRALISLPRGTGLRAYLDDACKSAGFQPRIAFEVGDPRIVAQLASRGLGVALLPESVISAHPTQLRAIPLARPGLRGRIALAWRTQQPASPAARAFINHARKQFTRPGHADGPGGTRLGRPA